MDDCFRNDGGPPSYGFNNRFSWLLLDSRRSPSVDVWMLSYFNLIVYTPLPKRPNLSSTFPRTYRVRTGTRLPFSFHVGGNEVEDTIESQDRKGWVVPFYQGHGWSPTPPSVSLDCFLCVVLLPPTDRPSLRQKSSLPPVPGTTEGLSETSLE